MTITIVAVLILIAAVVLFGIACIYDAPWLWISRK